MTGALAVMGILLLALTVPFLPSPAVVAPVIVPLVLAQVVVLAVRRTARADGILLFLFAIHVIAASIFGGGAVWAALTFLALLIVPGALVLSLLRREVEGNYRSGARDRSGHPVDVQRILRSKRVVGRGFFGSMVAVGAALGAFAIVFFAICPHFGIALLSIDPSLFGRGMSGGLAAPDFHARPVLNDDAVIARFETPDDREVRDLRGMRLRAGTFDAWDGKTWSSSFTTPSISPTSLPRERTFTFEVEPADPPLVLLPPNTIAIAHSSSASKHHYSAWTTTRALPPTTLSAQARQQYLALPTKLSPRVRDFAHQLSALEPAAIESHLKAAFAYDIDPMASQAASDPLDHFLFEGRRGHCLYFATSMAVILRENGIPARIASGFSGATYNAYGHYYAVRGKDAHAWVEAFIDGQWRSFDPTPSTSVSPTTRASSTAHDLSDALGHRWTFSTDANASLFVQQQPSKRSLFVALVAIAFITAFLRFARRDQPLLTKSAAANAIVAPITNAEAAHAAALYAELERTLRAKHGIVRPLNVPPERFSRSLLEGGHPLGEAVAELTQIYLEARFGGRPLTQQEIERYAALAS